jgi:hypothetical protein
MARLGRFFAVLALLVAGGGCDARNAQRPREAGQPATIPASLDERLLATLNSRRQWPSNAVKIWLKNPAVEIDLTSSGRNSVRVHAWPRNANDFNTAMMRLVEGNVLYAITDTEFEELRTREKRVIEDRKN